MTKSTMPIWVGLTLLMLSLVLTAALVFLFQELGAQRTANDGLQQTVVVIDQAAISAETSQQALGSQLTQQAGPLADYAATQTVVAMPTATVTPQPTPTAAVPLATTAAVTESVSAEPTPLAPEITIIIPDDSVEITVGDVLSITADVTDPRGLVRVWLLVDGVEDKDLSAVDKVRFKYTPEWVASKVGKFELAIGAENIEGRESSTPSIIVNVVAPEDTDIEEVTGENG